MGIISTIAHKVRLLHSKVREVRKDSTRDPRWGELRERIVRDHRSCAACGGAQELQVHHIAPFHLHPEMELDEKNLIVLCMGEQDCHLRIGHGGSFSTYNPAVASDAALVLREPQLFQEVAKRARANRRAA